MILAGCAPSKTIPPPAHFTAIEQFLLSQAVEMSLYGKDIMPLPLPAGESVILDSSGIAPEKRFLVGALAQWIGEQGLQLHPEGGTATYRIQILVQSLGLEQSHSFFGLPPIQSVIVPLALPEIAVYKAQNQSGFTRFRLDIFETASGKFIRSTPWFQASTYFNEYTVLFFIGFHTTNLIGPLEDDLFMSPDHDPNTD
jgi:hypothetical protein